MNMGLSKFSTRPSCIVSEIAPWKWHRHQNQENDARWDGCLAFQGWGWLEKDSGWVLFGRYGYVRISGWGNLHPDQGLCAGA